MPTSPPHLHFKCAYTERSIPTAFAAEVLGLMEVRQTDPNDATRSWFEGPITFVYDTGRAEGVVDEEFAAAHGMDDFRTAGEEMTTHWPDLNSPTVPAWRVYRWVRFRDLLPGRARRGRPPGGIRNYMFRIAFLVVPGIRLARPRIGLRDMHNFFDIASKGDEYWFLVKRPGGQWPLATDHGEGVRAVSMG